MTFGHSSKDPLRPLSQWDNSWRSVYVTDSTTNLERVKEHISYTSRAVGKFLTALFLNNNINQ